MNKINVYAYGSIIIFIILIVYNDSNKFIEIDFIFPDDFLIGTASSSYQVEGAWNVTGKSESAWDHFVHNHPEKIRDRSNADVACDSYHKYKEDIKLMKNIGINHYRFSISWPRILPSGYPDSINKDGLRYYHNILDELEKHGIEPFITIYHWDHPQSLERLGGWMNDLMVDFFAEFARIVFKEFGSRVKFFSTINEPYIYCTQAYETMAFAPGLNLSNWGKYICVHNMLKAHAVAYHIYNDEFRSKQNGQVGLVISSFNYYSRFENDLDSNEIAFEFDSGWIANPIFSKQGDYPEIMKRLINEKSKSEGQRKSRLPTFSREWIEYIKGSSDYFGLNHYSTQLVEPLSTMKNTQPSATFQVMNKDAGLLHTQNEHWSSSQSFWLKIVPEGFGDLLRKIKNKYNNPPVYILENGVSDADVVNDKLRIKYLYSYMKEMLIAMKRDKCNIKAYTIWSFLDSFEWSTGYVDKFGLINVDFNDADRKRTPKASVSWLKSVLKSRRLLPYD